MRRGMTTKDRDAEEDTRPGPEVLETEWAMQSQHSKVPAIW